MVGVFVDHQKYAPSGSSSESLESKRGPSKDSYHSVDHVLGTMGKGDHTVGGDSSKNFLNSVDEGLDTIGEGDNTVGGECSKPFPDSVDEGLEFIGENDHTVGGENIESAEKNDDEDDEIVRIDPDVIDSEISSDGEQSIGSDSEYSEKLFDSDYDVSDDDALFEGSIDPEVEWGGLPSEQQSVAESVENMGSDSIERRAYIHRGHPIFNTRVDGSDPKFELGMCFNDIATFRQAVRQHSINSGRDVCFTINHKNKVQAKCKHKSCKWMIYASKVQNEDTVQVKTYSGKHQCPRLQRVSHANSRFLADKYKDMIWTDPNWPIDSMMSIMQKDIKLHFNRTQLYRAKAKVLAKGLGSDGEEYALLWSYADEIKRSNPGTTVKIKSKLMGDQLQFKRFYICWGALKQGLLEGCRPVIFLDGCHLKTSCGGILLCALGVDANNGTYPFAYAVVEKEKRKSWVWFLEFLIQDLKIENPYTWTIVSDKQKGLVDAIENLLPGCEHRFCVMHLYQNFKSSFRGLALKNLLWKAARATRVVDFESTMNEIKERDKAAYEWLAQRPPVGWSRSHFSILSKCDMLLNNMSESFNAIILRARSKPIVTMLETIRLTLMRRIHIRKDQMEKYSGGDICPKIAKLLDVLKKKSMQFIAYWNGKDQFEIESSFGSRMKVHLGDMTCSCRKWELSGIPCAHAICAMYYLNHTPEDYVDACYKKETFLKTYNNLLSTLNGCDMWPKSDLAPLIPPKVERMPGRPKKHKRKVGVEEKKDKKKKVLTKLPKKGSVMACSICNEANHNARGCPQKKANEPANKGLDIPAPLSEKVNKKKAKSTAADRAESSSRGRKKKESTSASVTVIDATVPNRGKKREGKTPVLEMTTPTRVTRSIVAKLTPQRVTRATSNATSKDTTKDKQKVAVQKKSKTLGVKRKLPVHKKKEIDVGVKDAPSSTSNKEADVVASTQNSKITKEAFSEIPSSLLSSVILKSPSRPTRSSITHDVRFSQQDNMHDHNKSKGKKVVRDCVEEVPLCTQQ